MDRQKEFVLRTLEERDIRFVRLWFTDVLGYLKSVAIAPPNSRAPSPGHRLRRLGHRRFLRVSEADTVLKPDPSSFQILPWTTSTAVTTPPACSATSRCPTAPQLGFRLRHVLRRGLNRAADLGFSCYVHPEIEFFLLRDAPLDGIPRPR